MEDTIDGGYPANGNILTRHSATLYNYLERTFLQHHHTLFHRSRNSRIIMYIFQSTVEPSLTLNTEAFSDYHFLEEAIGRVTILIVGQVNGTAKDALDIF